VAATGAKISILEGLENLTLDLSICKWSQRWHLSWAKFQLPMQFCSRLRIRHGTDRERRTDRQSDNGHHCIMPHPRGM